ncbi:phosphoglucomutase (alpha-D-glucose-1,6-bisphosphate-dependent) [Desulfatitalea alkaliphila]|uniref:Phosphoglucomutase (Alpha-D-glucose-1,6-bisphosphate-dependent) n=1 Tax=Desulfatitalea alkaliphila TaxID=2929485 RepID=A0AA41R1W7_9BACT|nr:phosphoglucomutase (alpha-D-glucose-1,6-bisphosphate-dependent) [Desulfatitalea alkaliphila]MCJ8501049.1 phosphoglucomutase (alpha-D-glucose-1,6-bisphosphate-dependent) [Desulfatitalea alkaliphila]
MGVHPMAGKPVDAGRLVHIPGLITAYFARRPDPDDPGQRVSFGTSGHRGSSLKGSFNEDHILAVSQAICHYRRSQDIDGPLFLGLDTHALSTPASVTALEVLAANGVTVMMADDGVYTPTPAISHAILCHNRGRASGWADGIVITPSHNPPEDGGFKYNPPNGGPAGSDITGWIEKEANAILADGLRAVKRMSYEQALRAGTTQRHDFIRAYVEDLDQVIDMALIRESGVSLGVDPLGGAGIGYWPAVVDRYGIDLTLVDDTVDPTFRFMTLDWDGRIRMDPSSSYTMQRLIALKDRFQVAWGCDTDFDRHGIVTRSGGLLPPNHYLAVCVDYLFRNRPQWPAAAAVGKTLVSSAIIDRVAAGLERRLYEVPVGFKWFVEGLLDGSLGFGGEESAGASFLRLDGSAWSTDKDGLIAGLLAAEITARLERDPAEVYEELTRRYGAPVYARIDAPATPAQKAALAKLSPDRIAVQKMAGDKIEAALTHAPGNGAPIGGLKIVTANGWFAARPSGTEDIYKIYAESFKDEAHLRRIQEEAREIVAKAV